MLEARFVWRVYLREVPTVRKNAQQADGDSTLSSIMSQRFLVAARDRAVSAMARVSSALSPSLSIHRLITMLELGTRLIPDHRWCYYTGSYHSKRLHHRFHCYQR